MVVDSSFNDIFDISTRVSSLTLPTLKEHKLCLDYHESWSPETLYSGKQILPFADSELKYLPIKEWRCLTKPKDSYKPVYEITFDTSGSKITFNPGDTIGILPHNHVDDVNKLLKLLDFTSNADRVYTINVEKSGKTKVPLHIPVQSTLRYVLTHCIDLRGIVKKLFLLELSQYTENAKEKLALKYLSSKEGSALYNQHVLNKKLSFVHILNLFPTCKPPIGVILAHSTRLLPRPYSIANSMKIKENELKICFSVMTINDHRKGLTTGWLENLILEDSNIENAIKKLSIKKSSDKCGIPLYIRKNFGFKLPNSEEDILLICVGTGLAPFIGFLEEIKFIKLNNSDLKLGETWLYFGCRDPEIDYLYKEELQSFKKKGVLSKLCVTYSRIDNGGIKYVQDAIKQDQESIAKFIQKGAVVFVCGDLVTMATQVRSTIVEAVMSLQLTHNEAEHMIALMEKEKRYITDIWS